MKQYFVYILASKPQGVLYIGITNNLSRRLFEHMHNVHSGFSNKYHTYLLVYFEETNDIEAALNREKCLKRWKRDWKVRLIESKNQNWKNLYRDIKT